ncbi:MAG: hypothetical protein M1837_007004 [Sclerophora amabilis]|nr:MAG: hypothetical protein M1837_007004 [Sclerophora amabilis]
MKFGKSEKMRNGPRNPAPFEGARPGGASEGVMSKDVKDHFIAMTGEFVGTTLFLWFAFSATQIANNTPPSETSALDRLLFISLTFGFSLAVTAWCFYRVSGGLFNPAVTLGLCLAGGLPWIRGGLLFIPQMLGGMVAAGLVACMFPGPLMVATTLSEGTSTAQGLFIEAFLTFLLMITVLFLAAEKTKATFIAPVGIGLALFVAELTAFTGVNFTGGSLNPTRSFGPNVATREFEVNHWIYWLGPAIGASAAAGYYRFAKYMHYEEANPGQDQANQSFEDGHDRQH